MKSKNTALIFSILFGNLGVDRFYLGYVGMGILKLLTCGCLGILSIFDIIKIALGILRPADGSPYIEDTATVSAQMQAGISPYEELERIANLHKTGVLTDEEYDKAKNDCLAKM